MFIPLSDHPNYSDKRPWVNYGLVAVNVFVFLVLTPHGMGEGQAFFMEWGFVPATHRMVTYITSMFLHGGFMHLAGNMLFLWIFGDNVEGRLGHAGYLGAYLASGIAAVLLFQALSPDSVVPLVGASGAIFGVLGFYFLAFKDNKVRVLIWFFYVFWPTLNARVVLGAFFVIDFVNLVITENVRAESDGGGVAYAAHVGGFGFGLLLAFAAGRFLPSLQVAEPRRAWTGVGRPSVPRARLRLGIGAATARRYDDAYAEFEAVVRAAPNSPVAGEAALHMAMIRGRVLGDFAGARGLLRYAILNLSDPALRRRAEAEFSEIS